MSIRPCLCVYFNSFPGLLPTLLPPPHLSARQPDVTRSVCCWWATRGQNQTAASGRVGEINEQATFAQGFPTTAPGNRGAFLDKIRMRKQKVCLA